MTKKEQNRSILFDKGENPDKGNEFRKKAPGCPTGEQLAALVDHRCSLAEREAMQAHIKECEICKKHCMTIASFKMSAERTPSTSQDNSIGRWGCIIMMIVIVILTIVRK